MRWTQRFGFFRRTSKRTIWLHASEPRDFEAAEPLVTELAARYPRLPVQLLSGQPAILSWLELRHPADVVLPTPWALRFFVRRFLRSARPRLLILLGEASSLPRPILEGLRRREISIALVDGRRTDGLHARLHFLDRICMRAAADAKWLEESGVPDERVIHTGAPLGSGDDAGLRALQRTLDALEPLVRRDLPKGREARRGDAWGWRRRLVDTHAGQRWLERSGDRLDSFDELRERLGCPRTLLCLGNGPSSEHPELRRVRFDALFRVNWRWLERGWLTHPDVVFTGDRTTLARVGSSCFFGFRTIDEEIRVFRRRFLRPRRRPLLRYFTYERLPGFLNERRWGARPTNGAVMLATAVELQPARLVIAGIDLFADPAGSYPGGSDVPNAYVPVHDRESELVIIQTALHRFRGEVEIFGDVLRERLGLPRRLASEGQPG